MKSRSSLWNGTSTSGPAGGAHRRLSAHRRSPRSARARAMRGILVLALALGSLGAVAVATMGHAGSGHSHSHGGVAISHHWMWLPPITHAGRRRAAPPGYRVTPRWDLLRQAER